MARVGKRFRTADHRAQSIAEAPVHVVCNAIMWTAVLSKSTPLGTLVALHGQAAGAAAKRIGNRTRDACVHEALDGLAVDRKRQGSAARADGSSLSPDVVPQRGDVVLLVKLGGIIVHAGIALGEQDFLGRQRMLSLAAEHPTFGEGQIPRYGAVSEDGSGVLPSYRPSSARGLGSAVGRAVAKSAGRREARRRAARNTASWSWSWSWSWSQNT